MLMCFAQQNWKSSLSFDTHDLLVDCAVVAATRHIDARVAPPVVKRLTVERAG